MNTDYQHILMLLGVIFGGGVGASLVSQGLKKVLGLKSDAVIHTMVVAVNALVAILQYVVSLKALPIDVLGVTGPAIYGVSQIAFRYSRYVSIFLAEVQAKRAEDKAAQAPVTVTPTEQNTNEFSV